MVDKSEKIAWAARLGYGVRGVVYILLGGLALASPGRSETDRGPTGSLEVLAAMPAGPALLTVCAVGLAGYALYKAIAALFDSEGFGTDAKGIATRSGYLASSVVYGALAWTASRLAAGSRADAGDQTRELAARSLEFDLGSVALGLAGLALFTGAAVQARQAATASFMKRISASAPRATCWIGRAGLAARAVVFVLMGISLLRSAWFERSGEAQSLGTALTDLRDMGSVYTLVAAGFVLFGVFSLVSARYRVIQDPDPGLTLNRLRMPR